MAINDYVTTAEVKAALPDLQTFLSGATTYDALLTTLITRASRRADRMTGRPPGAYYTTTDTSNRYDGPAYQSGKRAYSFGYGNINYNVLGGGYSAAAALWIDELCAVPTTLTMSTDGGRTNVVTLVPTDYFLWPDNAANNQRPYLRLDLDLQYGRYQIWYSFRQGITITGRFGYSLTVPDDIKQAVLTQVVRWFKRSQMNYQTITVQTDPEQSAYREYDPEFSDMIKAYRRITI